MKKRLISVLFLVLCLLSVTVLAEGKLKATEKNLIIFSDRDSGRFYAKVENVGDSPIGADSGDLVVFSDDDEIVLSESYVSTLPSYVSIEPGDYLYVNEYIWDTALKQSTIGDYKFSIPSRARNTTITKIPCEAEMQLTGIDTYENYVNVTFTNTNEKPLEDFIIVAAMHDAEGNLIYVESNSYSNLVLHSGSTVTINLSIENDLMEYYKANSIVPTMVEAMVCYENE